MRLGSQVAVAVVLAGICSSNLIPSLGTSICRGCGPKEQQKKKQKTKNKTKQNKKKKRKKEKEKEESFCLSNYALTTS